MVIVAVDLVVGCTDLWIERLGKQAEPDESRPPIMIWFKLRQIHRRHPSFLLHYSPDSTVTMPLEPPTLAPPQSYTFTVPARRKRHPPAPGCSLCTILTTLEDAQTIPPTEEASQHANRDDPPFSPALPSPALQGNPLLPSASQPATAVGGRVLLLDDDELTAWVASPAEELAREGRHVVIAFKRHVEDVYAFVRPLLYPMRMNLMHYLSISCIADHAFFYL